MFGADYSSELASSKFGLGMKAYLNSQGYSTYIAWNPES